jgi:ABC-type transport system substrate-binding protein
MNKIHLFKKHFFNVFNRKKKKTFFIFLFLGLFIFVVFFNFYLENTKIVPIKGGTHIEGVIGLPRFINPIYGPISDIDRDLTKLTFSGLMRYDENNQLVPALAKNYNILENGKIFEFYLREGLVWSDNTPLTVDDVIFTIRVVQNPALHSPIRTQWLNIEVEKISDLKVRFILKNPSPLFLENATLGIMPKHIWLDIPEEKFPLSKYNLQPIGSGPYKVKDFYQDEQGKIKSLNLIINPNYWGKQPYISQITFLFFENEAELIKAFENNEITGFSIPIINNKESFEKKLKNREFLTYRFFIPRYFALFFNPEKSEILERSEIRKALNYGTDRKEIIAEAMSEQAKIVNSPILPEIFGFAMPEKIQEFNFEKATELLIQEGFTEKKDDIRQKITRREPAFQFRKNLEPGDRNNDVRELQRCLANFPEIYPEGTISGYFGQNTKAAVIRFQEKHKAEILAPQNLLRGTGSVRASTRDKLNNLCYKPAVETLALKFSLTTANQPLLIKIAEQLKNQWKKLGIELEIKTFNISELKQEVIKLRNYEILLFGQSLGAIPDPFPFWHSNQKRDPGLNLSLFKNRRADELLEKARQTLDQEERRKSLEEFQNILIKENPSLFLFNPAILYFASKDIKGISEKVIINPSKRFHNIENWYIETQRVWKR